MKYKFTLLFCVILAILTGYYLGNYLAATEISYIAWLGFGKSFGFDTIAVDLSFIELSFGLHIDVNFLQLILVVGALYLAPRVAEAIKPPKPPKG